MKIIIIYDSCFGNTEKVAQAIGTSLKDKGDVIVVKAGDFSNEMLKNVELLVVGSPTQRFKPLQSITNLLNNLPEEKIKNIKFAAFDTRSEIENIDSKILKFFVKLFGYAAEPIDRKLDSMGAERYADPKGFYVTDKEGPLREGELERAERWIKKKH